MMIQLRSRAVHRAPADAGGLPSPVRASAPYAVILAATPVFSAGGSLTQSWAVALGAAAVLAGAGSSLSSWVRRVMLCDLADRWIATGAGAQPPDAAVTQRREELLSARERRMLATSLRRLVAASPMGSARVPTDRRAVTAEAALIERLAAHLADVGTPVEARSVARVHMLVSDAGSPLYRNASPVGDDLHRRLTQVLFEIERGV